MSLYRSQKCGICGKEEALIFVKIITDGKIEEKGLCAHCALKYMNNKDRLTKLQYVDQKILDALEEMKGLLTSIVSNISAISGLISSNKKEVKCNQCGLSFDTFKSSGFFGCPNCYPTFKDYLKEFILEVERGPVHKGKMPKRFIRIYLLKKEIQYLKNQLKKSILSEKYEEAERIKKKLYKLIGSYPVGKEDEIS